jgi:hypothetical protein
MHRIKRKDTKLEMSVRRWFAAGKNLKNEYSEGVIEQ